MKLQILTPDKVVYDGDMESLLVPGAAGPFEILKDHAPILSSLVPGELRIVADKKESIFNVTGGFLEFHANQAVVLAEAVETPQEIDVKRVEEALKRSSEILANLSAQPADKAAAQKALARAQARKKLLEKTQP
jgi:F-type H+-transporting ATPase subunit epsilon